MATYTIDVTAASVPGTIFTQQTPSTATWHTLDIRVSGGNRRTLTMIVDVAIFISTDGAGAAKTLVPANTPFDIDISSGTRYTYYINGASTYNVYFHISK